MDELSYLLEQFPARLERWKDARIVIHGERETAAAIVAHFGDRWHFTGLIPYEPGEAKEYFGLPTLTEEALGPGVDLLLITEYRFYGDTVFRRIRERCEAAQIAVLSMYGVDLLQTYRELERHPYQDLRGWKALTREYDVVSFALLGAFTDFDEEEGTARVRPVFRRLNEWLRAQGKTVIFFGRKRLPDEQLKDLLVREGLVRDAEEAEEHYLRRTNRDLNFRTLRERFPQARILHIGIDLLQDGVIPRRYGVDSYHMAYYSQDALLPRDEEPSPSGSGWAEALAAASTEEERSLVNMSREQVFAGRPEAPAPQSLSREERLARYVSSAAGPMLTGYLSCLLARARKIPGAEILFIARDGWIVKRVYDRLRERWPELPPSVYFYCTRRTAFQCLADDWEQLPLILDMGKTFTPPELLQRYYCLAPEQIRPWEEGEDRSAYIRAHAPEIRREAEAARERLRRYLDSIDFEQERPYLFCDFVGRGTAQLYLERVLGRRFSGLYFGRPNYYEESGEIEYYCRGENSFFTNNYMEMEVFMSSPEPSLDRYDELGRPVFAREPRSAEEIRELQWVQDRMERFALDYFERCYRGGVIDSRVCEELYAADGCHRIFRRSYDDWGQFTLERKGTEERHDGA